MSVSKSFKNIAEEYSHRIWDKRDRNAVRDLLHPNIIIHSLLGDYYGHEAMLTIIDTWLLGFPDLAVKKLAIINEEDRVVIQWKAHGTHRGEFKTIKPTGKSINYEGVTLYKVRENKITEYWAYLDMQHLLNQIK